MDPMTLLEFKNDERSRVFEVETPEGVRVIKIFRKRGFGQAWRSWIGLHPAQVEARRNRQLTAAGVPVVPIVERGVAPEGRYLATPRRGESLQRLQRDGAWPTPAARRLAVEAAAGLARDLFAAGFVNRDLKTSNVVVDPLQPREAWMIDVGGSRRSRDKEARRRTVDALLQTFKADGFAAGDVAAVERVLAEAVDSADRPLIEQPRRA